MIKINDRFEFERGDQCWNLHEWKDGVNPKTKEPTRSKTTTYHSKLEQVCSAVIDRELGKAEELSEIAKLLWVVKEELKAAMTNKGV